MIKITTPLMPPATVFESYSREAIASKYLSNGGQFHQRYEQALAGYLGLEHISLVANGTLAITLAIEAAISHVGEVITTPYSFVATVSGIRQAGCSAVFADIDPITKNLSPECVAQAITENTVAILPVHVHGVPCDIEGFARLSKDTGIPVIYDAAHALGVTIGGQPLLSAGSMSTLSLHATKVASSVEGGAIVCATQDMKHKLDTLHNFGFEDDGRIVQLGCNAKMSELHAAFGLAVLPLVAEAILKRKMLAQRYLDLFAGVPGLSTTIIQNFEGWNGSYMPVYIDESAFRCSRDTLHAELEIAHISSRKYFAPLISEFDACDGMKRADQLLNARVASSQVLCLPLHHELTVEDVARIAHIVVGE